LPAFFMNTSIYLYDLKTKFEKLKRTGNKYYLSYSGGQDSEFLRLFIEQEKITDIPIVAFDTRLEWSEIRERQLKYCDEIIRSELTPFEIKAKYGSPCFTKLQDYIINEYQNGNKARWVELSIAGKYSSVRYNLSKYAQSMLPSLHKVSNLCCYYLKKQPSKQYTAKTNRLPIIAVTGAEGQGRKSAMEKLTTCFTKKGVFQPLYDITDNTFKHELYAKCGITTPRIYNLVDRTGCVGCPYGCLRNGTIPVPTKKLAMIKKLFGESHQVKGIKLLPYDL